MSWFHDELARGDSVALVVIVYIVAFICCVLLNRTTWSQCVCLCDAPDIPQWDLYLEMGRGYRKTSPGSELSRNCFLSFWAATHLLLFAVLGFVAPRLFFPVFIIGAIWEVAESFLGWHCVLDLLWNLVGFAVGASLRQLLFIDTE